MFRHIMFCHAQIKQTGGGKSGGRERQEKSYQEVLQKYLLLCHKIGCFRRPYAIIIEKTIDMIENKRQLSKQEQCPSKLAGVGLCTHSMSATGSSRGLLGGLAWPDFAWPCQFSTFPFFNFLIQIIRIAFGVADLDGGSIHGPVLCPGQKQHRIAISYL